MSDRKPKVLIACSSCWRDYRKGCHDAIRQTWGQNLPEGWDLRFFVGGQAEQDGLTEDFLHSPDTMNGELHPATAKKPDIGDPSQLKSDEIFLPSTPDGYLGLTHKTVDSLQWALDQGYDYIFRIFCDTYVIVDRLAKSGFEGIDGMGWLWHCEKCPAHDYMHKAPLGGTGYWVSRKGAQSLIDTPIVHWAEDAHAGYAFHMHGMSFVHDGRLPHDPNGEESFWKDRITLHLGDRHVAWGPEVMSNAHKLVQTKLEGLKGCKKCGHSAFRESLYGQKCRHCGALRGKK
jgi:hypothetical protein